MSPAAILSKHFNEFYFGGNWTSVHFKSVISDVSFEQASIKINDLNSILSLVFHIHYYVNGITKVLEGGPLDIKDTYSFDHPVISSQEEWKDFLNKIWEEGAHFASLVASLPAEKLDDDFTDPKYGSYFRNLMGVVEHGHYHLGQIMIIKKIMSMGY